MELRILKDPSNRELSAAHQSFGSSSQMLDEVDRNANAHHFNDGAANANGRDDDEFYRRPVKDVRQTPLLEKQF